MGLVSVIFQQKPCFGEGTIKEDRMSNIDGEEGGKGRQELTACPELFCCSHSFPACAIAMPMNLF
jgi:hypothetical protein